MDAPFFFDGGPPCDIEKQRSRKNAVFSLYKEPETKKAPFAKVANETV